MARNKQDHTSTHTTGNLQFGWWKCRPKWLQCMNSPKWFLFFMFMYFFTQSIVVNGVYSVSITTIEKRYGYTSSLTGFLTSSFDIAALVFTPFVSFLGAKRKKPVWCGVGLLTMGIGMLIFMMPHLLSGQYEAGAPRGDRPQALCNSTSGSADVCPSASRHTGYFSLFVLGMVVMGTGATPMIALGVPYMDENVKAKVSPMYVGIFFASGILGAGVGFVIAGVFLAMYVDIGVQTSLTPNDERWVGAWWLGFVVSGVLCIMWSFWLFGFPRHITRGSDNEECKDKHRIDSEIVPRGAMFKEIKYLPKATKGLLRNISYIGITFAGCLEIFLISGSTAFSPKMLQSQLRLPTSQVSFLYGVTAVTAALGGSLLGSYINKRLRLSMSGAAKMCLVIAVISALVTFPLMLSCDTVRIAGVNTAYTNGSSRLTSDCNSHCACSMVPYSPVCSDGVAFFSSCHAGCVTRDANGTSACSCLPASHNPSQGSCRSLCGYKFPLMLAAMFLLGFFTFLNETPATIVTLRCLPIDKRTYGIGFQWVLFRLLGGIPGPIVFGSLIDRTCILWDHRCKYQGNCLEYNNTHLAYTVFGLCLACKLLVILGFLVAWISCRKLSASPTALHSNDEKAQNAVTTVL